MTNMRDRLKSILASAALIAPLLLVSPASAAFTSRDVLIKGPGTGVAVYYLANDGKRYVFPNQKTYKSWFTSFSGVYTITPEEIASFPIGGNVTYRPGIRLVKIDTDPKVYAVDRGGTLRWIMTESAAAAIYGGDWNTKVDDVPDAFFTNYLLGPDISSASQYSPFAAAASATTINADKGISTSGNATVSDTSPAAPGAPSSPPPPPPPVVPPPSSSCSADVWVCTTWSACDSSGSQTRTCSLTTDCPGTTSATPAQT